MRSVAIKWVIIWTNWFPSHVQIHIVQNTKLWNDIIYCVFSRVRGPKPRITMGNCFCFFWFLSCSVSHISHSFLATTHSFWENWGEFKKKKKKWWNLSDEVKFKSMQIHSTYTDLTYSWFVSWHWPNILFLKLVHTCLRLLCVSAEHSMYLWAPIFLARLSPSDFLNGDLFTLANCAKASLSSLKSIFVPEKKNQMFINVRMGKEN